PTSGESTRPRRPTPEGRSSGRKAERVVWRSGRLVLVDTVVERLEADPEDLRRLLLVPFGFLEGGEDEPALRLPEGRADLEVEARARALLHAERQAIEADVVLGEDEGAVDQVLQLAHVAGPIVAAQPVQRGARELLAGIVLLVEQREEVLGEQVYVLPPVAQRGQRDREHVEPVEQVLTELALGDRFLRLAVGGRDHAHVRGEGLVAADAGHLARF